MISVSAMASVPQQTSVSRTLRRIANASRAVWFSPTALVLIVANLLPLYGVLVLGWAVFPMMVLFWLENVMIGILNVLRIKLANPTDAAKWASKLLLAPFFTVHYGLFTAVHGLLVFSLFGGKPYEALVDGLWTMDAARHAITEFALWPGLAALAASHLFSFFWNYLGQREFQQASTRGPDACAVQPRHRAACHHHFRWHTDSDVQFAALGLTATDRPQNRCRSARASQGTS
jgi:hypothetical protein